MVKTASKMFQTSLIENPTTTVELDFNELKLNSVITEIEQEILAIRVAKIQARFAAQELAKTRLEGEEKSPKKSWFARLFNKT